VYTLILQSILHYYSSIVTVYIALLWHRQVCVVSFNCSVTKLSDQFFSNQVLLKLEPPSGRVFPTPSGGRMVSHPHREPTALSYLLPLSRHTSSPTPTDPKATLPSQCHPTTQPKPPKPATTSYTKQATVFLYTP
jgi:hypothetical protein